jgi:hypothetical protein
MKLGVTASLFPVAVPGFTDEVAILRSSELGSQWPESSKEAQSTGTSLDTFFFFWQYCSLNSGPHAC